MNNQAATFTMALCGPDSDKAKEEARESFEWYPKTGARQIATLTDWMAERKQELGSYSYAADMKKTDDEGTLDLLSLEYLVDANACVLGTPEECLEACRAYEAAGVDLLLCLVNPYKISARVGHADHRAHGHRGDPALRRLTRARAPLHRQRDIGQAVGMGRDAGRRMAVALARRRRCSPCIVA